MNRNNLQLKDILVGSIDAKNELLTYSPDEIRQFMYGFIIPPNIVPEQFLNKFKYFITGLKGTGKTALLRYLALKAQEQGIYTSFLLFKSNIDEEEKKLFARASRITVVDSNSTKYDDNNFEIAWRWYIYKHILNDIQEEQINLFERNIDFNNFKNFIQSVNSQKQSNGISSLFPKLRKGTITISKQPELKIDFDWNSDNQTLIKFYELVKIADNLFNSLIPGDDSYYLFIDELELSLSNQKRYQRDAELIRDLIVTIDKFNSLAKRKGFNICIFAGIRSEVLTSVISLGKEINKIIGDFSSQIVWHRKTVNFKQQPLLDIIIKRIHYSEKLHSIDSKQTEIWNKYFPEQIQRMPSQKYILHNSWYRPRDFVRLLNIAKDQFPYEEFFSQKVFDCTWKQYSTDSWIEIAEELAVNYNKKELTGIKRLFYGYKPRFTFYEINEHAEKLKNIYTEVDLLIKYHRLSDILSLLYKLGVIGNIYEDGRRSKIRFSFRGDDDILLEKQMFIHYALRSYFSIS